MVNRKRGRVKFINLILRAIESGEVYNMYQILENLEKLKSTGGRSYSRLPDRYQLGNILSKSPEIEKVGTMRYDSHSHTVALWRLKSTQ